jgi:hypothetical protein
MTLTLPLYLLAIHWFGDFVLQTDWQAIHKSQRFDALCSHVFTYSLCFLPLGIGFFLATFFTHFATDFITSRINARLWFFQDRFGDGSEFTPIPGKRHWFFVMLGLDQLIHAATLAATWTLLR